MSKHFRQLPEYKFKSGKVDRENGVIHDIVVVEHGRNKNGSYFNQRFLHDFTTMANAKPEGVKSRFGHPNMCSSDFGNFLGRQKNFRIDGDRVLADLHLSESSKKSPGGDMYTYTLDMAEENPDMFGNSISIMGETEEVEIEGVTEYVMNLEGVEGSDLVGEPAATKSLFSDSEDIGVVLTQFLDFHGDTLFSALNKNPKSIEIFFNKYKNYSDKMSKDSKGLDLLKRFKNLFSTEVTDATGEILNVETENGEINEGDAISDENGGALPNEDIVLADGTEVSTDENSEVDSVEETEKDHTNPTAEEFGYVFEQSKENSRFIEDMKNEFSEFKNAQNALMEQILENQKEFAKAYKHIGAELKTPELEELKAEESEEAFSKGDDLVKMIQQSASKRKENKKN